MELDDTYFQSLADFWLNMWVEFSNIPSPNAIKIKGIFQGINRKRHIN